MKKFIVQYLDMPYGTPVLENTFYTLEEAQQACKSAGLDRTMLFEREISELYFLLVFEDGEGIGVHEFSSIAEAKETGMFWASRMWPGREYVVVTV